MVAVGAGDAPAARRYAGEAERLLGRDREPLALLLKAQAAQAAGDRETAEATFRRMAERDETRVLGLRGLFVEARRRNDGEAARLYAAEAARLAPAAGWANEAVLEAQSAEGDWRGALDNLNRRASLGVVDRAAVRRQRAVLLAADALGRAETDEDGALAAALEAVKLAPDLVPAATVAARILSRRGELKRASRIVEAAWRATPHPDLAEVYLNLRAGDSALDRLKRAETLAKWSSWDPESRLALASAAIEAREYARARQTLDPLVRERPTVRVCLLMADLEEAEHGPTGRSREWMARAARAPRDPAWIADGVVSDEWRPISPVTGRLDAFVWQSPPDLLAAPGRLDDVTGDLDEGRPPPPAVLAAPSPAEPERVRSAATAEPARAAPLSSLAPAPAEVATAPDRPAPAPQTTPTDVPPLAAPAPKPNGAALAEDRVSPADEPPEPEPARADRPEVKPAPSLAG
jgi:HemY protein